MHLCHFQQWLVQKDNSEMMTVSVVICVRKEVTKTRKDRQTVKHAWKEK